MIPAAISSLTESAQIEGKLKNLYCRLCFGFTSRIRLLDRHPWLAVVTFPAVSRELTISNENQLLAFSGNTLVYLCQGYKDAYVQRYAGL